MKRCKCVCILTVCILFNLCVSSVFADSYNLRVISPTPPGHTSNRIIAEFGKLTAERTKGAVTIQMFEGTLGAPSDAWDMMKTNIAQLAFTSEAYNAGKMPILSMVGLPFEIPDVKCEYLVVNALLKAGYLKELTNDAKVIFFRPVYPQCLFFSKKKVNTVEEFKGLKIRANNNLQAETLSVHGVTAITLPGSEIYMAMSTGVIDGFFTAIDNARDRKFYEVSKYALNLPVSCGIFVLAMNKTVWENLPTEIQNEVEKVGEEVSAAETEKIQLEENSIWKEYGAKSEVYTLKKEEQEKMREAGLAVTDRYVKDKETKGYPAREALSLMRNIVGEYTKNNVPANDTN